MVSNANGNATICLRIRGYVRSQQKVSLLEAQHVLYGLVNVENEAKKYLTEFSLTVQNLEPKEKKDAAEYCTSRRKL